MFLALIQIPEHLEQAIEAAVSGSLQDIVVENSQVAKQAIQHLRERKAGKASFLPLDMLKGTKKHFSKVSGVLGIAAIC
ncbi:Chromosome partition protein Smc [Fusobacterium necrophorum subsp. necrophorum]|nr:Chromosome partition protein Smc [Fusobacterium necrophorum subsp. necrophorum]